MDGFICEVGGVIQSMDLFKGMLCYFLTLEHHLVAITIHIVIETVQIFLKELQVSGQATGKEGKYSS